MSLEDFSTCLLSMASTSSLPVVGGKPVNIHEQLHVLDEFTKEFLVMCQLSLWRERKRIHRVLLLVFVESRRLIRHEIPGRLSLLGMISTWIGSKA